MNLVKVIIEGYRSIKAPQVLPVNELVTILIGANDHGKTNILEAVQSLNNDKKFQSGDLHWDLNQNANLPHVQWYFSLTEAEVNRLKNLEITTETSQATEVPKESAVDGAPVNVEKVEEKHIPKIIIIERKGIDKELQVQDEEGVFSDAQKTKILAIKPIVELFEKEQKLPDLVKLEDLEKPEFETVKGLFIKAGLWETRQSLFVPNNINRRQLEEASEHLTTTLRDEWEQGSELKWKLGGGTENSITMEIEDPAVLAAWIPLSRRSKGFTSFFVLALSITARNELNPERDHIYLFDEPGNNLHPVAQVNLQRVFESLSKKSQIVYTTHSIFLINNNEPTRNNVVRKTKEGTLINKKPYIQDWKAVRDSLGLALCSNFLISDKTLLVEGPSDKLYIYTALHYLMARRDVDIDLNNFSIVDAGNARNMIGLSTIMVAEGRKVVVLVDGDKAGKRVEKEIRKARSMDVETKKIQFLNPGENMSTEDILPHKNLLLDSVIVAAKQLSDSGARIIASGKDLAQCRSDLENAVDNKGELTLGRLFDIESSKFFQEQEGEKPGAVGKVSTAVAYEDAIMPNPETGTYIDADDDVVMEKLLTFAMTLKNMLELHSKTAKKVITEKT